jgi:hypothetical protein
LVAKAIGKSPFDKDIQDLTQPQIYWVLINYYKDQEEELEKWKMLCRFVNPAVAHKVFDQVEETTVTNMDSLLEEINKHSSKPITREELESGLSHEPGEPLDITPIEKV